MENIARAFERRVGHLIRYEHVVTRIENMASGVRVMFRAGGRGDGEEHVETADFAICTVPATVLRGIENNFRPAVQSEIRNMEYNTAVKIGMQARRRFWEEDLQIYAGITWTNQPITQIWYPAQGYHRHKGILLAAYTWNIADTNPFFQNKTPDERLVEAVGEMEHIHPGVAAELESGISVAWGTVPFQLGGWASETSGNDHEALSRGDGNVYFAGEHVSFLHGWQEGAVISAHAAVEAIAGRVAAGALGS